LLKALIFDFDGLILDTETPELLAWQEIFAGFGVELTVQTWGQVVGGTP
jgi:beta-phosphoglucomutase-like phosphatase (HAD superfamily)